MKRPWLWPVILILAGLAAYSNTFRVPFIYDDYNAIVENPHVKSLWPPVAPPQSTVAGRPVVSLTLALNHAISGLNPWSYHIFNLAIHIANALLLFGIVRRSVKEEQAGAVALVWLVHPLLTDSVTYTVQRTELLMAFCLLVTLYCVLRNWQFGAVMACALGMGCKEVMVVAPLVVLLYDRTFLAGTFREALRQRGQLYAMLAATWLVLVAVVAGGARAETVSLKFQALTPWQYAVTQGGVILHYLRLAVWPHPLVVDYDDWPVAHGLTWEAVVVAGLVAGSVWLLCRRPKWGFLCACFFLILAPTSSFVPIVSEVAAERRMYLPLIALVVPVVMWLRWWSVGLVLLLAVATGVRNHDYRTELTIMEDTVAKRPGNARALTNLGVALVRAGRMEEAVPRLEAALVVNPRSADAHFNLAMIRAEQKRWPDAARHLERVVELEPGNQRARANLQTVLQLRQ